MEHKYDYILRLIKLYEDIPEQLIKNIVSEQERMTERKTILTNDTLHFFMTEKDAKGR